jgi:hypothetical protein
MPFPVCTPMYPKRIEKLVSKPTLNPDLNC